MIKSGINGEIRNENECRFNRSIAMICGIRPALIAQYLWEIMEYENGTAKDAAENDPDGLPVSEPAHDPGCHEGTD